MNIRVGIIRNMNTKSEFVEQMARVSERNSGAPAKGRKNIGSGKRATRVRPLLKIKNKAMFKW